MAKIGKFIAVALLLCPLAWAEQEPRITVVVQPNPVSVDDSLQMRVEVTVGGGGEISPPTFDAAEFTVVGKGSSSNFSTVYENGSLETRQRKLFTFVLAPKREGVHKISKISAYVGGKQIESHDIAVKVLPGGSPDAGNGGDKNDEASQNPAAPGNSQEGTEGVHPARLNSDFTVFLRLSKKQVYVGEPVVAEYFIYSPGGIKQIDIKKWPTFNGFWKEDLEIPSRYEWEPVYVAGRQTLRVLVGRFALYPIKAGKTKVDQLLISAKYLDRSGALEQDDPFGLPQIFGNLRVGTHGSPEQAIEVLPLPEAGRPENFSGAVGQFRVALTADKKQAPANSPINLEFSLEGTGNFHAIDAPKLGFPKDFELYESKANFQLGTPIGVSRRLENKKAFTYLVLPRKEGSFTIPSYKFSWFDSAAKAYRTAATDPITLEITPDAGGSGGTNTNYLATDRTDQKAEAAIKKPELRFLKPISNDPFTWLRHLVFALVIVNLLLAGLWVIRKISIADLMNRFSRSPRKRMASLLGLATRSGPNSGDHHAAIERCLYGVLDVLLARPALGMTREEISEVWRERLLPAPLLHKINALFDAADRERFAGGDGAQLQSDVLKRNSETLRSVVEESIRLTK